jgi:hypothetical protein
MLILFCIGCFAVSMVNAQEPFSNEKYLKGRIVNLEMLLQAINQVSDEIEKAQTVLQGTGGLGREKELREKITDLSLKKNDLEATFNQLATNVETGRLEDEKKTGLDLKKELKELLSPAFRELKKLTIGPREIEKYRNDIETYELQLLKIKKAIDHIDDILGYAEKASLVEKLNDMRQQWLNLQNEIKTRMHIAQSRLERKLSARKSFSESAKEIMQLFFKSRGRNLLLSFLAFLCTWLIFFYLHKPIRKYSPIHHEKRSFYARLFDVLYYFCGILFSLFALLAVLYFSGDWVLLSVSTVFIIGIGWASKQALPLAWQQAKLMLNIGPVREGELVVFKGIPYEVKAINLYTQMINESLSGGTLRLPIKDLLDLRSRPLAENEPWFPCEQGEWVKLSGGTHGKVLAQTPETIKLELLGGAVVSWRTLAFLSQAPVNLSSGFRLWVTFRIDYEHRAVITSQLPEMFEKELPKGLAGMGYEQVVKKISVQFKNAGPSSLDLEILADFFGAAAPDYEILKRAVSSVCIDICNNNDWIVPLRQVKVHLNS